MVDKSVAFPYIARMNLQHLTDQVLHADTLSLVARERELTTKVLHHLKEIDRRKLFSDHKCTSLFDYCVRLLGYSEASAQRRIIAARLLNDLPELEKKIEDGKLTLTNISQANQFFRENDVKDPNTKKTVLRELEDLSKKECEKKLFELFGSEKPAREEKKRISSENSKVTLILSDETWAEVEKLKALLGKDLSMDELIRLMAKTTIEKVEAKKFKQTKPRKSLPPAKVARTPVAEVKRQVYRRDKHCAQCGSLRHLNFDHIKPYAHGGGAEKENIRLLCFQCNQRAKIKVFGTKGSAKGRKGARQPQASSPPGADEAREKRQRLRP